MKKRNLQRVIGSLVVIVVLVLHFGAAITVPLPEPRYLFCRGLLIFLAVFSVGLLITAADDLLVRRVQGLSVGLACMLLYVAIWVSVFFWLKI